MDGNTYAVKFIQNLNLEMLPAPVLKQAKICLLDLVGASLAGAKVKGAKILLDFSTQQMNLSIVLILVISEMRQFF